MNLPKVFRSIFEVTSWSGSCIMVRSEVGKRDGFIRESLYFIPSLFITIEAFFLGVTSLDSSSVMFLTPYSDPFRSDAVGEALGWALLSKARGFVSIPDTFWSGIIVILQGHFRF